VLPPETSYGSDRQGIVWAYAFDGETSRSIDAEEVERRLATPPDQRTGFVWLHLALSNAAARTWALDHDELPQGFHDSFNDGHATTHIELEGDALVAVIRDVLFNFTFDPADVSSVSLCVLPHLLVSARLKPLRSIDRLRDSVKRGEAFRSPAELLARLLRHQAAVLEDIVRQSTARVDRIEDDLLEGSFSATRADLGTLRRVLARLKRLLAPEPGALFRLLARPPHWLSDDDVRDLRQAAEEFATVVGDCGALLERVRLIQEELSALVAEQDNKSLFVLTIVTVMAVPINVVAGLFGMNVGGVPFSQHSHGFWMVVGLLAALTSALGVLTLRARRR
jgi:zinc transporter